MTIQKIYTDGQDYLYQVGLTQKEYSIFDGNKKFREDVLGYQKVNYIDDSIKTDPNLKLLDRDFQKYLTVVGKDNDSFFTSGHITMYLYGIDSISKQLRTGKTPNGIKKSDTPRVLVGYAQAASSSSDPFLLFYLPTTREFMLTQEPSSFDFISRGINKLFKISAFTKTFKTVFEGIRYMDSCIRIL